MLGSTAVNGQTAITAATFGPTINNADQVQYTTVPVTFLETSSALATFTTGGGVYHVQATANSAYVRRNAVTANNSSVWYNGLTTSTVDGNYKTTLNAVLLNNNQFMGTDNTFANTPTGVTSGNIERVDFVWNAGLQIGSTDGFAVFERGATGAHDAFKIAVITGWDAVNNKPTTYSKQVTQAANWGATNLTTLSSTYQIIRYGNGDNLTNDVQVDTGTTQGLAGLLFQLSDFGIAANTTIYGYSVFADDGTTVTTAGATLADWTNTTYYPTNSANGLDLSSINGIMFSKTPEPATYGAILVGLGGALAGIRRWRNRQRAA